MIRRLRIKLTAVAMLSLLLVLAVIIAVVNTVNYRGILREADGTLELLEGNNGRFPSRVERPREGERTPLSAELPFQSRFFTVALDASGNVSFTDLEHIAAVDQTAAAEYAETALAKDKSSGFVGDYRYLISQSQTNDTRIIFLDCNRELATFRSFLWASCGISLAGLAMVFLLIVLLSGRIVRPVSAAYEKQKQFITDAGHELKTPLTIIDADTEVLALEMGENEWLRDIRKQTERLGGLTNDLVYLSRLEESRIPLQRIDFPLSDLTAETAQSFQVLARTQGKKLELEIAPMLSMCGEEKAIRQLLCILLDNALKYSPRESSIVLHLRRQGKNACLELTNEAEHVEQAELDRLFDRFYRADPSRNSQTGGYGIGLSIAKAIVNAHHGKITADAPAPGQLRISVRLPLSTVP